MEDSSKGREPLNFMHMNGRRLSSSREIGNGMLRRLRHGKGQLSLLEEVCGLRPVCNGDFHVIYHHVENSECNLQAELHHAASASRPISGQPKTSSPA